MPKPKVVVAAAHAAGLGTAPIPALRSMPADDRVSSRYRGKSVALTNYGVVKGRAIDRKLGAGKNPHYQIHALAAGIHFRISVNVKSKLHPSELLYLVSENFRHPITDRLGRLPLGFTRVRSSPNGMALDYIRGNLLSPAEMQALPHRAPGPDNDLNDKIDAIVQRAIVDERALVYAFGNRWGPLRHKKDSFFRFTPRNGLHDIHMNQGSHPLFQRKDGVWRDGGLLFQFPWASNRPDRWLGVFLKFQSQAWHTDDTTGRSFVAPPAAGGKAPVRIAAARVHPDHSQPAKRIVTLRNRTSKTVDISNWALSDIKKNLQLLQGSVDGGGTRVIPLQGHMRLPRGGGIITLLDGRGIKVDGVSYTKAQARRSGSTIVF